MGNLPTRMRTDLVEVSQKFGKGESESYVA